MFGCVLRERERERERENLHKTFSSSFFLFYFFLFFLQNEESGGIYTGKVTLQLLVTLLTSTVLAFSRSYFRHVFEGLLGIELS